MKLKFVIIAVLPFTLYAQTRNYDQELANLLFEKRIKEAQCYYAEYEKNIVHPFVIDSYHLISNIYAGKTDSVLLQLPVFISNYYGNGADDNLLLFFPTLYRDAGEYDNELKVLDVIEAFFNQQKNEEVPKAIKQYMRNCDVELFTLLFEKRIEKAQQYYTQIKDRIINPFVIDSYHLISNIYAGKTDSVLLQLPVYIGNYYGNGADDNLLLYLPTFYWDLGEYGNGLKILDILEAFFTLQQSEGQGNEESLKNAVKLKNRYREMNRFPPMEIKISDNNEVVTVPIKTDPWISFTARYNQTFLKTVFDTGCPEYFFTRKKSAEKAGIKVLESYSDGSLNGIKTTRLAYGMLDSIFIGNLLLKNVPVMVIEDDFFGRCLPDSIMNDKEKLSKDDSEFNQIEILMGLPVIKMLNQIQFDLQDNEMLITLDTKEGCEEKGNMYISNNRLCLCSKINGLDCIAFVDTGGNLGGDIAILIENQFYRDHIEYFPLTSSKIIETHNSCGINGSEPLVYFRVDDSTIHLGNKTIDLGNRIAIQENNSLSFMPMKNGFIGLELFKKLKKFSFNFAPMRLECE